MYLTTTIPVVSSFKIQVCTLFIIVAQKDFSFSKGKCVQEGTFFENRFPSLGNFVNKKVGFRKN